MLPVKLPKHKGRRWVAACPANEACQAGARHEATEARRRRQAALATEGMRATRPLRSRLARAIVVPLSVFVWLGSVLWCAVFDRAGVRRASLVSWWTCCWLARGKRRGKLAGFGRGMYSPIPPVSR